MMDYTKNRLTELVALSRETGHLEQQYKLWNEEIEELRADNNALRRLHLKQDIGRFITELNTFSDDPKILAITINCLLAALNDKDKESIINKWKARIKWKKKNKRDLINYELKKQALASAGIEYTDEYGSAEEGWIWDDDNFKLIFWHKFLYEPEATQKEWIELGKTSKTICKRIKNLKSQKVAADKRKIKELKKEEKIKIIKEAGFEDGTIPMDSDFIFDHTTRKVVNWKTATELTGCIRGRIKLEERKETELKRRKRRTRLWEAYGQIDQDKKKQAIINAGFTDGVLPISNNFFYCPAEEKIMTLDQSGTLIEYKKTDGLQA